MRTTILGVEINQIDLEKTIDLIVKWLEEKNQRLLATVNPEFVVAAQKDEAFRKILNQNEINVCDGFGLVWAARFLYGQKLTKVAGADLAQKLLASNLPQIRIFLLGGEEGVAKKVGEKYPRSVAGFAAGGKLDPDLSFPDQEKILAQIRQSRANILFAALAQVKQEKWIKKNLPLLPSVKVGIGLGGTFDYLSGKIKRAPKIVRKLGLEWFFRLIAQPSRVGRIYNATIKFVFLILKEKWRKKPSWL